MRSHRFAAANTALPFVNHDAVQLKAAQDFLRDGQISVDVFGLVCTVAQTASDSPQAVQRIRSYRARLPSARSR